MKVLIVDDHILFRQGLVSLLRNEADFEVVGEAGSASDLIRNPGLQDHIPDRLRR